MHSPIMSVISGLIVIFSLISLSLAGSLTNFIKVKSIGMVPGIQQILCNSPNEELRATKRFILEAQMAGDTEKINLLRIELFKILTTHVQIDQTESFQNQQAKVTDVQPTKRPSFLKSKMNALFSYAIQKLQPQIVLNPEFSFDRQ